VRIIAATNVLLEDAAKERRFREDLYFRLRGFSIRVPALAERVEDIGPLMQHFALRLAEREGLPLQSFSPGAIRAAEAAEWPGNIRRLRSAVEEAVLRAHDDQVLVIQRHHLFPDSQRTGSKQRRQTFQEATRECQARFVVEALEEAGWNIQETADLLDITRSHVYNLIKAFGLKRKG
jgi:Nif-specific regulatory protein